MQHSHCMAASLLQARACMAVPSASVSSASVSSALTSRCARRRNRPSLPLRASLHSRTAFRQRCGLMPGEMQVCSHLALRSPSQPALAPAVRVAAFSFCVPSSRQRCGLLRGNAGATGARSHSLPLRASLHSRTVFRVQSSSRLCFLLRSVACDGNTGNPECGRTRSAAVCPR